MNFNWAYTTLGGAFEWLGYGCSLECWPDWHYIKNQGDEKCNTLLTGESKELMVLSASTRRSDFRQRLANLIQVVLSSSGFSTKDRTCKIRCQTSTSGWQPCRLVERNEFACLRRMQNTHRFLQVFFIAFCLSGWSAKRLYWIISSSSDNIWARTMILSCHLDQNA